MMVLSNGYKQSFLNLKFLESIPSLRALRAFFISSHLEFIGRVTCVSSVGAPSVRYVLDVEYWYGKP